MISLAIMGYVVRKNPSGIYLFITKIEDGVRRFAAIPHVSWKDHGFDRTWPIERVKERARELNKDKEELRQRARREGTRRRIMADDRALSVGVPGNDEFEEKLTRTNKFYWRSAQKLVIALKLRPQDMFARRIAIWDWFLQKQYSRSYVKKVLRLLNQYGEDQAWKLEVTFRKVPAPDNRLMGQMDEASQTAPHGGGKESLPLTPKLLAGLEPALKDLPGQWNWLYLTVWFGLRPSEVDALHKPGRFRWSTEQDTRILHVSQSKLVYVKEADRWKAIPCIYKEQVKGAEIVDSGNFTRPLCKTIQRHLGENYTLYGGRKGFTDLMINKGQLLENASQWMGHASIERTWRSYKSRKIVRWT